MRIENNLNEWFEEKRKEEGINKVQQAEKIGFSPTLLSHYANGNREISKKALKKIVQAYNLNEYEQIDLYKATLTTEEIERVKEYRNKLDPEEFLVYLKYGVK